MTVRTHNELPTTSEILRAITKGEHPTPPPVVHPRHPDVPSSYLMPDLQVTTNQLEAVKAATAAREAKPPYDPLSYRPEWLGTT
ncbi:MAG: hypothetical protein ABII21_02270 [bacterium]